jgi:hypothetical protein
VARPAEAPPRRRGSGGDRGPLRHAWLTPTRIARAPTTCGREPRCWSSYLLSGIHPAAAYQMQRRVDMPALSSCVTDHASADHQEILPHGRALPLRERPLLVLVPIPREVSQVGRPLQSRQQLALTGTGLGHAVDSIT